MGRPRKHHYQSYEHYLSVRKEQGREASKRYRDSQRSKMLEYEITIGQLELEVRQLRERNLSLQSYLDNILNVNVAENVLIK